MSIPYKSAADVPVAATSPIDQAIIKSLHDALRAAYVGERPISGSGWSTDPQGPWGEVYLSFGIDGGTVSFDAHTLLRLLRPAPIHAALDRALAANAAVWVNTAEEDRVWSPLSEFGGQDQ